MKIINTDININNHSKKENISSKLKCYRVNLIALIYLIIDYNALCLKAQIKTLISYQKMMNCKI